MLQTFLNILSAKILADHPLLKIDGVSMRKVDANFIQTKFKVNIYCKILSYLIIYTHHFCEKIKLPKPSFSRLFHKNMALSVNFSLLFLSHANPVSNAITNLTNFTSEYQSILQRNRRFVRLFVCL